MDVVVLAVDASDDVRAALQCAASAWSIGIDGREDRDRYDGRRLEKVHHLLMIERGDRHFANLH